jgi:N-acyl homoserine lactone hydrolase
MEPSVRRVDFGYFVRPASETGTGRPRAEPCLGYLVDHPDGLLLVDTGMGASPEVDEHYRPVRRPLAAALAGAGARVEDVRIVVNCHLHFDHCGGNPLLRGRPVVAQRTELAAARTTDYSFPSSPTRLVCGTRCSTARRNCCRVSSSSRRRGTRTGTSPWSCAVATAP